MPSGWWNNPNNTPGSPLYEQRQTRWGPFTSKVQLSAQATQATQTTSPPQPPQQTQLKWSRGDLLSLIYDLAWAASFANLSANTRVTSGEALLSYTVIFLLLWWIWVAQAAYHMKFKEDDWLNRMGIFVSLAIFCTLSALTKNFDLFLWITHPPVASTEVALTGSNSTKRAQDHVAGQFPRRATTGIAIALAISRLLLLFQYCWRRYVQRNTVEKRLVVVILMSFSIMVSSCAVSATTGTTVAGAALRPILWVVAILVESVGTWRIMDPPEPRRMVVLVGIIMSEKINGLAGTFQALVQSPNFGTTTLITFIIAVLIILLNIYLYFDTAWVNEIDKKAWPWLWVFCHFLYMVCLIFTFEGTKNVVLYTGGAATLLDEIHSQIAKVNPESRIQHLPCDFDCEKAVNDTMIPYLFKYGFAWDDVYRELVDMRNMFNNGSLPEAKSLEEIYWVWSWRIVTRITMTVAGFYLPTGDIQAKTTVEVNKYLSDYNYTKEDALVVLLNGALVPAMGGDAIAPHYTNILRGLIEQGLTTIRILLPFVGLCLWLLAGLDLLRLSERDKFQSMLAANKLIFGFAFILLATLNAGGTQNFASHSHRRAAIFRWLDSHMALPTIVIGLFLVVLIDHVILYYSLRGLSMQLANPAGGNQATNQGMGASAANTGYPPPSYPLVPTIGQSSSAPTFLPLGVGPVLTTAPPTPTPAVHGTSTASPPGVGTPGPNTTTMPPSSPSPAHPLAPPPVPVTVSNQGPVQGSSSGPSSGPTIPQRLVVPSNAHHTASSLSSLPSANSLTALLGGAAPPTGGSSSSSVAP